MPIPTPSEPTSSLLLDRPRGGSWVLPGDRSADASRGRDEGGPTAGQLSGSSAASQSNQVLVSPGVALLVTVSILEGYTWIGALPSSDSRLSTLVFGRGGALVFAAMAAVAAVTLTRAGADGRRTLSQRLVLLATAALITSTVLLLVGTGAPARDVVGVSDLALASTLAGSLIAGERTRRARRHDGTPNLRGDRTGRSLPLA